MNPWVFVPVVMLMVIAIFLIWNWNLDRVSSRGFKGMPALELALARAQAAEHSLRMAASASLPALSEAEPAWVRPTTDVAMLGQEVSAAALQALAELELLTMRYLAQIAEWMGYAVRYGGLRADDRFFTYTTNLADRIEHIAQYALEGVPALARTTMLIDDVLFMRNLSVCFREVSWTAGARPSDAALVALLDRLASVVDECTVASTTPPPDV